MLKFINPGAIRKIQDFSDTIDKYCTVILGCLWTIATLWDIVTFQCFWSDYMLELYSCFFIIFMVLYVLFPDKVPKLIKEQFGIITTIFGRGIIMIIFSLIFLVDKHILHKLSSIFLFIGGVCLFCLSFFSPPEDKYFQQDNNNISQENDKNASHDDVPETKIDDSTPRNDTIDSNP